MNAEQFVWWLKGYLSAFSDSAGLSTFNAAAIRAELDKVSGPVSLPPLLPLPPSLPLPPIESRFFIPRQT